MTYFRWLFTVTGVAAAFLGGILILAPGLYLSLYTDRFGAEMAFPAQRFGPAIVGLGALMVAARDLSPGPFASRFAAIAALVWLGVAATGVFHYATGLASYQILVAATSEVVLCALFLRAAVLAR